MLLFCTHQTGSSIVVGANLKTRRDKGIGVRRDWRRETRRRNWRAHLVPYAGLNLIRFNGIRNFPISAFASRHPDKNEAESNQEPSRKPCQSVQIATAGSRMCRRIRLLRRDARYLDPLAWRRLALPITPLQGKTP